MKGFAGLFELDRADQEEGGEAASDEPEPLLVPGEVWIIRSGNV